MKLKMLLRLLLGIYSPNDYIIIGRKMSVLKKGLGGGLFEMEICSYWRTV